MTTTPPGAAAAASSRRRPARLDVVVVGAGQAGLAMGYFLARRGLSFLILERAPAVGQAWRERWDSLVLFTPARYSALPGMPFPGDPDHYPTRDEVISYLERYAERFELPVALGAGVASVRPRDGGYVVAAGETEYEADQVVVATGPFQVPHVPAAAERIGPDVVQMHSTGYRGPADLPAGTVLVVGGGNTGVQIAEELSRTHDAHLAVGSRQTPLPQRLLGRDLFWWLNRLRLMRVTASSPIGRRMKGRDVLVGSSPRRLRRRHGVELHPRVTGASDGSVAFADGSALRVDGVVWATGYRLDHDWLHVPKGEDGALAHRRGVTESPGLYLLGMSWQHTRGSALLGWVAEDAEFIAERIAARRAA
jgi:putative flavoprotein involved in K+ transport